MTTVDEERRLNPHLPARVPWYLRIGLWWARRVIGGRELAVARLVAGLSRDELSALIAIDVDDRACPIRIPEPQGRR